MRAIYVIKAPSLVRAEAAPTQLPARQFLTAVLAPVTVERPRQAAGRFGAMRSDSSDDTADMIATRDHIRAPPARNAQVAAYDIEHIHTYATIMCPCDVRDRMSLARPRPGSRKNRMKRGSSMKSSADHYLLPLVTETTCLLSERAGATEIWGQPPAKPTHCSEATLWCRRYTRTRASLWASVDSMALAGYWIYRHADASDFNLFRPFHEHTSIRRRDG